MHNSRRGFIKYLAMGSVFSQLSAFGQTQPVVFKRAIPKTSEKIPAIGLGTWQTFDVGNSLPARNQLKEVLKTLISYGGSVVDSSPMYGSSERVVGELVTDLGIKSKLFGATKVWTSGKQSGINQMNRSMDLMKIKPMDLMQVHNLQDWKTHLNTLRNWKDQGKVRYIGITHYMESAYPRMEKIMKEQPLDFIQLNYSIKSRQAENSILPLAADLGIAVLVNRPYEGGSLFRKMKGTAIPQWASEMGIESWGQFFIKYILGNEAITCVIPGTSKPHHMKDNLQAGLGRLPSENERKKMVELVNQV